MGFVITVVQQLLQIAWDTLVYWGSFLYFWWGRHPINRLEIFGEQRLPLCHIYMLAQTLHLWDAAHYRAPSFADDLRANLKNVAIPCTGIPLSVFCYNKATALLFILLVNPAISLAAAVYITCSNWLHYLWSQQQQQQQGPGQPASIEAVYRQLLLFPDHWFAIWRHSCFLVGYHALATGSSSYRMEAKGTFLLEGQRLGLPVSPFYTDAAVFVKHTSIEGGMGIHVFRNFAQGGDWVIQRALSNSDTLSRMLPPGAPLSTLRVVTASTAWLGLQAAQHGSAASDPAWRPLRQQQGGVADSGCGRCNSSWEQQDGGGADSSSWRAAGRLTPDLPLSGGVMHPQAAAAADCSSTADAPQPWNSSSSGSGSGRGGSGEPQQRAAVPGAPAAAPGSELFAGCVQVVTAVWRAGLAGKDTDHSSICFPVDPHTGQLSAGVSSNFWYRLGLKWLGRLDGSTAGRLWLQHPDSGALVAGCTLPDMHSVMRTVLHAHLVATPDVPLVGWDVALTPDGVFLLEMNLSCNLFNGHFDSQQFYGNMFLFLTALDGMMEGSNKDGWVETVAGQMTQKML